MGWVPRKTNLILLARRPGRLARAYRVGLIILLLGATADVVTTFINMRLYGVDVEAHIVQRWVSQLVGGTLGVPLAKIIQLGFVVLVAAWWRPWCFWLLSLCGLLYAAAAVSNHFLLL